MRVKELFVFSRLANNFWLRRAFVSFWAVFLYLGLSTAASLNIMISPPRGGYGDTAVNLMMIERMSEYYRNTSTELSVHYTRESAQQIHDLWPDFKPDLQKQIVRGLEFTLINPYGRYDGPQSDVSVTFSARQTHPGAEAPFFRTAKNFIVYYEYAETAYTVGAITEQILSTNAANLSPFKSIGMGKQYSYSELNTGLSNGLYVLDGFRPQDSNKQMTMQSLQKFAPQANINPDSLLAYAYCSSQPLAQQYVEAAQQYAARTGKRVTVVTNQKVQYDNRLVTVVEMKSIPFNLNQKVIKSADLPVLVTGDGSMSLAIEGRKPFFYALYAWKLYSPLQLKEEVLRHSPYFKKNKRAQELLTSLTRLDLSGSVQYTKSFLEVFENEEFQREFTKALDYFVKNYSLVKFVEADMKIVDVEKNHEMNIDNIHHLWSEVRKGYSVEEAITRIERQIFDARKPVPRRISMLLGLIGLKQFTNERQAQVFSRILAGNDAELKYAFSYILQNNLETEVIQRCLPFMNIPAKREYIKVLKNLGSQPGDQWGQDKVDMAMRRAHELEIQVDSLHYKSCQSLMTGSN